MRVGSTPRGTEEEQREHLPPHQEQLFNPPRRGDAGMGEGEQRRARRWQAKQHSSAFLFHLFTFSVSSNSPPPVPYTQWVHGDWWCTFSLFFFLHISLSKITLRKHQLPVYLQIYKIQADVLISCAGENSRGCAQMCASLSVH